MFENDEFLNLKRRRHSKESKQRISEYQKDRIRAPHSVETRQKMSEAKRGKRREPLSDDHKSKIGESLRKTREFKNKIESLKTKEEKKWNTPLRLGKSAETITKISSEVRVLIYQLSRATSQEQQDTLEMKMVLKMMKQRLIRFQEIRRMYRQYKSEPYSSEQILESFKALEEKILSQKPVIEFIYDAIKRWLADSENPDKVSRNKTLKRIQNLIRIAMKDA